VSESSPNPVPEDEGSYPFNAEQFARETIQFLEFTDDINHVNEERLMAIEEAIAARWPRRWLLWARLRLQIRASVASWPDEYVPRNDFRGRRGEWADQESMRVRNRRTRRRPDPETQTRGWEWHTGWDSAAQSAPETDENGRQDPGEGYLP
jgi:hypothetical protein